MRDIRNFKTARMRQILDSGMGVYVPVYCRRLHLLFFAAKGERSIYQIGIRKSLDILSKFEGWSLAIRFNIFFVC